MYNSEEILKAKILNIYNEVETILELYLMQIDRYSIPLMNVIAGVTK